MMIGGGAAKGGCTLGARFLLGCSQGWLLSIEKGGFYDRLDWE